MNGLKALLLFRTPKGVNRAINTKSRKFICPTRSYTTPRTGPLAHLKVLDLSRVLAGPWAAQLLADLGAEVIKVEQPGRGDDTRAWGPPFMNGPGGPTRESAYYLCANRGKQSITVDYRTPRGQAIVHALAKECDVLLENFKVGALAKYRLDYASIHALNPALVYCSITGYGQTGPRKDEPGYDLLVQGMGGLMSFTGEPHGPPIKAGVALVDCLTGLFSTIGILSAIISKKGQHVDVALFDSMIAALVNQGANYLIGGQVPARLGNSHPNIVPYGTFEAQDGHVIIAVGNDQQFAQLCQILNRPELATDEKYARNPARVTHRTELVALINSVTRTRAKRAWIDALTAAGVPAAPVNDLHEVFSEPQAEARDMKITMPHPLSEEGVRLIGNPIKLSQTPVDYQLPPPTLGQHTEQILQRLGYTPEDIAQMRQDHVI